MSERIAREALETEAMVEVPAVAVAYRSARWQKLRNREAIGARLAKSTIRFRDEPSMQVIARGMHLVGQDEKSRPK
jgi:hypothetical protein